MSHLDLLLVHLENEYFQEKIQSHHKMTGEKPHLDFLLMYILEVSIDLIRYQDK